MPLAPVECRRYQAPFGGPLIRTAVEGRAMTDKPRIEQLLDELLDSHATPEEVCLSCPELLPQVRQRWRHMCRVQAELDAMFPPTHGPGEDLPAPGPDGTALPQLLGYEVEALLGRGGMGVVFR